MGPEAPRPDDARIAYGRPDELLADLAVLEGALRRGNAARLAGGQLHDLIRRVQIFGFHLARLDLRQHSAVLAGAMAEVLRVAGVEADYLKLDEAARVAVLAREIANRRDPAARWRDWVPPRVPPWKVQRLERTDMDGRRAKRGTPTWLIITERDRA